MHKRLSPPSAWKPHGRIARATGILRRRRVRTPASSPWRSRSLKLLRILLKKITWKNLGIAFLVIPTVIYVYREVTRDVLIIDPFTVPKTFADAGLTSEVIANRIGDSLRHIEQSTQTRMKKDNLGSLAEEGSIPEIEIPGTKLGLKAAVDVTRSLFGVYPKHISGAIVLPIAPTAANAPAAQHPASVTIYITEGHKRSPATVFLSAADDLDILVQRTAETVLEQINPYVFAAYQDERRAYPKAIEVIQRILQDPASDRLHKIAAHNLWGDVLRAQLRPVEAIAQFQQALEIDPGYALAYSNWGALLLNQKKYPEAIAKFQKANELDPKASFTYYNWGAALDYLGKYDEAAAKFQKAADLDPNLALAYAGWADVLAKQQKPDEAIAKYRKAAEKDPNLVLAYKGWGDVLDDHNQHQEAIAIYQKALEINPKAGDVYNNLGTALQSLDRNEEAIANYRKAIKHDPRLGEAYQNLAVMLYAQGKHEEAAKIRQQAAKIAAP